MVLGGRAHKCMMCGFYFPEKSLLSVFPSFQGRIPGAKKLDLCRDLQILSADCDFSRIPHSFLYTHVLAGRG